MTGWTTLSQNEYDEIWDRFYKDLSFKPSVVQTDWPSITTDKSNIKIDIADFWGDTYNETKWISLITKGINSFICITNPEEDIIALDWQHACFKVNPKQLTVETMLSNDQNSIIVPSFVPDGDYYIFLTKDFENIWFGHPWEKTVTLIGDKLIKAYKQA